MVAGSSSPRPRERRRRTPAGLSGSTRIGVRLATPEERGSPFASHGRPVAFDGRGARRGCARNLSESPNTRRKRSGLKPAGRGRSRTGSLALHSSPAHSSRVKIPLVGPSIGRVSLALLLVALAVGVPIGGHADHDGDIAHIGTSDHSHGLGLAQHEMRFERAVSPLFVVVKAGLVLISPPTPKLIEDVTPCDDRFCESRAPPDVRPRAPPL